jgi:hypothetical protein
MNIKNPRYSQRTGGMSFSSGGHREEPISPSLGSLKQVLMLRGEVLFMGAAEEVGVGLVKKVGHEVSCRGIRELRHPIAALEGRQDRVRIADPFAPVQPLFVLNALQGVTILRVA